MKQKNNYILKSVLFASLLTALNVILFLTITNEDSALLRISLLLGGDLIHGGYIQWLTYIAFFWAMFEIKTYRAEVNYQYTGFNEKLLPENKLFVFSPDDIRQLKLRMIEKEEEMRKAKKDTYWLSEIIFKSCIKFDNTKQVSEVMDLVTTLVRISQQKFESRLSNVRYLIWAIPSIGFIGTVLGIAQALSQAHLANTDAGIRIVTNLLGVAFDTTLIALLLSLIVMYLNHQLEEKQEQLHCDTEEYLSDNLVNRIVLE